jgi:hypothetical protein
MNQSCVVQDVPNLDTTAPTAATTVEQPIEMNQSSVAQDIPNLHVITTTAATTTTTITTTDSSTTADQTPVVQGAPDKPARIKVRITEPKQDSDHADVSETPGKKRTNARDAVVEAFLEQSLDSATAGDCLSSLLRKFSLFDLAELGREIYDNGGGPGFCTCGCSAVGDSIGLLEEDQTDDRKLDDELNAKRDGNDDKTDSSSSTDAILQSYYEAPEDLECHFLMRRPDWETTIGQLCMVAYRAVCVSPIMRPNGDIEPYPADLRALYTKLRKCSDRWVQCVGDEEDYGGSESEQVDSSSSSESADD